MFFFSRKRKTKAEEWVRNNVICPECRGELHDDNGGIRCTVCGSHYRKIRGASVFMDDDTQYVDQIGNTGATNPYSPKSLELIRRNSDAVILDFGAGNPKKEELFHNVVRMDFLHYSSTHIVSNKKNLPFRDGSVDHIISESVFEHVQDPWHCASELHRVLKKGGRVLIDTAFMQPVHSDPYHFYNMTLQGLKETFKMFTEIRSGVEPYQTSGTTLNILTRQFIDLLNDDSARKELRDMVGGMDFARYDRFVPSDRQGVMAAGVYFVGYKE